MSLSEALKDFLSGIKISDEEIENRRAVCGGCDNKDRILIEYCKICKCSITAKTAAPREQCPLSKW
jgi:hypothetical protein